MPSMRPVSASFQTASTAQYFYSKEILTDCPMIRFFPDSGMYYLLTMQFDVRCVVFVESALASLFLVYVGYA